MSKFICVRCGYSTDVRSHIKDHLRKNKVCPRLFIEIDRDRILEMLENSNEYLTYLEPLRPLFKELSPESIGKRTVKSVIPSDEFIVIPNSFSIGLDKKASSLVSTIRRQASSQNSESKPIEHSSEHMCTKCSRTFNNRQNRWRHEKLCKERGQTATNIINNSKIIDNSKHNSDNKITNINSNNTTNNTMNLNQQTIVQRPLCVFGEEDISHIVHIDRINDYERIARRDPGQVIPMVVRDIYFDREHPENHTIKIKNKHGNLAMIRVGLPDQWEYVDRKQTINQMIKKSINATETGEIDTTEAPKYESIVNDFYSERYPKYNSTVKSVDKVLVIEHQRLTDRPQWLM